MSTTVTGKLNKAANQFQAGESTGFGIRLGVKYRDPKTKADEWTNYQAVIFAKSPGQIQFYQSALVEGAVIEITCEQLAIEQFQGQSGLQLSINMLNARLGFVFNPDRAPQQQAPQYQQQPMQTQPMHSPPQNQQMGVHQQQQPQQGYAPASDFDDDIPFNGAPSQGR